MLNFTANKPISGNKAKSNSYTSIHYTLSFGSKKVMHTNFDRSGLLKEKFRKSTDEIANRTLLDLLCSTINLNIKFRQQFSAASAK